MTEKNPKPKQAKLQPTNQQKKKPPPKSITSQQQKSY